jgi:hypothetical protein
MSLQIISKRYYYFAMRAQPRLAGLRARTTILTLLQICVPYKYASPMGTDNNNHIATNMCARWARTTIITLLQICVPDGHGNLL